MSYEFDKAKYIKFAKKCFKVINGKINTVMKARELRILDKKKIILRDEYDSITIATASCNTIYLDIRMIECVCRRVAFPDFQIKSLIVHFIAHELSHLDQIMFDMDSLNNEIANELNTIKFLYKNKEYLSNALGDFDIGDIYISDDGILKLKEDRAGIISSYSKYMVDMSVDEATRRFPYVKARNALEKFNDDASVVLGEIDLYKAHKEDIKNFNLLVVNSYRDYTKGYKIYLEELFTSDRDDVDDIIEDIYRFLEDELFVGYRWTGYVVWDEKTRSICYQYETNGLASDGYVSNFEFFIPKNDEFDSIYDRIRIEC